MDTHLHLLTVLGLGAATLWGAIPAGLALGLDPLATGVAAAAGAALGTLLVLALGDRIRSHPWAVLTRAAARHRGIMYHAWASYGAPGLGLLAPLVVGAPLGAAMGLLLGAPAGRLAFWMMLGIVVCSAGLTLVAALGLAMFQH